MILFYLMHLHFNAFCCLLCAICNTFLPLFHHPSSCIIFRTTIKETLLQFVKLKKLQILNSSDNFSVFDHSVVNMAASNVTFRMFLMDAIWQPVLTIFFLTFIIICHPEFLPVSFTQCWPPQLAQPCYVALGQALDSGLISFGESMTCLIT